MAFRMARKGSIVAVHGATWDFNPKTPKETFAEAFEQDYIRAMRDYAAEPPETVTAATHDAGAIERFYDTTIMDPILPDGGFADWFVGNPLTEYYIHGDLSKTRDSTGFAVVHYDIESGRVVADMLMSLVPTAIWKLSFERIIHFVMALVSRGFRVVKVTFDGWQSYSTIERIANHRYPDGSGIDSCVYSVDRGTEAYDTFFNLLHTSKLVYGKNDLLFREVKNLKLLDGKKYDHPATNQDGSVGCFVGDTKIPLLDGTTVKIRDLVDREIWVYSSAQDGSFVPGRARGRKTKQVCELVEVTIDTGEVEFCTPEHLWRLKNGSYKEAQYLVPDVDRLMPLSRSRPDRGFNKGYEVISQHGKRNLTSHLVLTRRDETVARTHVVHHKNEHKYDNRPENLELKSIRDHHFDHAIEKHQKDPNWRLKLADGVIHFNKLSRTRNLRSASMKRIPREEFLRRSRLRKTFRDDITLASLLSVRDLPDVKTADSAAKCLGCGRNVIVRILRENGFDSWNVFVGKNHKVKTVRRIHLDEPIDVYDLEVDDHSNFALASGVFVHNSKDLSDAFAAAATNCVKSRIGMSIAGFDLETITHDEHILQMEPRTTESGGVVWDLQDSKVLPDERQRVRTVRIDQAGDDLLFVLGWYWPADDRHYVDEFLLWERFDETCLNPFRDFVSDLLSVVKVQAFSLGGSVPLDVVTTVQRTGRSVSTPLNTRVPGQHRHVAQAGTGNEIDLKVVRMALEHVRRKQVSLPRILPLFKDIRHSTDETLHQRPYLCCFAQWWDFSTREIQFGRAGRTMPKTVSMSVSAPVTPGAYRQTPPEADPLARVRQEVQQNNTGRGGRSSALDTGPSRTLPRSRRL